MSYIEMCNKKIGHQVRLVAAQIKKRGVWFPFPLKALETR